MKRRAFLVAAAALTAGCPEIAPEPDPAPPPDSDEWEVREDVEGSLAAGSETHLVLDDHDFATAGDSVRVRGTVRNTRDEAYPGVEVEVELFSSGGANLASGERESDGNLGSDETWRFAVVIENVEADEVDRYEIETGGASPP